MQRNEFLVCYIDGSSKKACAKTQQVCPCAVNAIVAKSRLAMVHLLVPWPLGFSPIGYTITIESALRLHRRGASLAQCSDYDGMICVCVQQ